MKEKDDEKQITNLGKSDKDNFTAGQIFNDNKFFSQDDLINQRKYQVIGNEDKIKNNNLKSTIKRLKEEYKEEKNFDSKNEYINEIINVLKANLNDLTKRIGKYIFKNGSYYIGEWSNGLKHGKGIIYNKNNTILYEGYFFKDKFEGNGKFTYKDGEYYIGEFLNGLRHGKGTIYYKDKSIKYDGNFIYSKAEGYGIRYL